MERAYRLLGVPQTNRHLSVKDDPAAWGEPTFILDQRDQTTAGIPGILQPSPYWKGPDDLSARVWLRWDRGRLYLGVVTRDDHYANTAPLPELLWRGDGIQIAFDAGADVHLLAQDGYDQRNDSEWMGGIYNGAPMLVRGEGPGEGVDFFARRMDNGMVMAAAFPWSVLAPATGEEGALLGFNLIVNDDDGAGRNGWIGLTGGIGESKAPRLFYKLVLRPESK
jgi:hypothetical protein